jgi:hypothetical protein
MQQPMQQPMFGQPSMQQQMIAQPGMQYDQFGNLVPVMMPQPQP